MRFQLTGKRVIRPPATSVEPLLPTRGAGLPRRPHLGGLPVLRNRGQNIEGVGGGGDLDGLPPTTISLPAFTMTGASTVQANSQTGTALRGGGGQCAIPTGTYLNLSNQPFTIEFLCLRASGDEVLDRRTGPIYQNWVFDTRFPMQFSDATRKWDNQIGTDLQPLTSNTNGNYRHFAVTRDSVGDFRLFDNGILVATATDVRTKTIEDAAVDLQMARGFNATIGIGSIRITKGANACRYKQNFVPFSRNKFPLTGDPYGNLVSVLLNFSVAPGTAASSISNGQ